MVFETGVQAIVRGQYGHIVKMYCFNNIFFRNCTITVVGGKVMTRYYVFNNMMLNCKIHCPGHGAEFKLFIDGGV